MTTPTPTSQTTGSSLMLRLSAVALVVMVASAWVAGLAILQLG